VVVAPISFVSEHSETLVELDRDYRRLAENYGVPFYRRVPTVDRLLESDMRQPPSRRQHDHLGASIFSITPRSAVSAVMPSSSSSGATVTR